MATALVIGSGFAGSTAALLLTAKGHRVTLVEREAFLGGGSKTHVHGGHPFTLGPRHFVTYDERIFAFLDRHVPLRRIEGYELLTFVEGDPGFYHYPLHEADLARMPDHAKIARELDARDPHAVPADLESFWLNALGPTLYAKFVERYVRKMWGIKSNTELPAGRSSGAAGTSPIRTGTKAAWADAITAFPFARTGYDDYFTKAAEGAEVLLRTSIETFDMERRRVRIGGEWRSFDLVISTVSPEILLNGAFGPLRWMGRELWKLVLPVPAAFPPNVHCVFYSGDEPFMRVTEFKKFYAYEAPSTLLGLEIPSSRNRLFPYPGVDDQALARRYLNALPDRVFSLGRAGRYVYAGGISEHIAEAIALTEAL